MQCLRKFKCYIGKHDWHVLESKSSGSIEHELTGEWFATIYDCWPNFQKKICLRCGVYVDDISKHRDHLAAILGAREARKLQGKMLHAALYGSEEISFSNDS